MNKVLVIEDEDHLRNDIVEALQFEGFDSHGAEDGKVGIQRVLELKPDVIVCDVMMPELDGYQVLDQIRNRPETETTPFIFLTALGDRSHQRQGMEGGADDYVSKPFQTIELVRAINKQMEKKAARIREVEGKLKNIRDSIFQTLPHEIRTPLMSILGYAELLVEGPQYFQQDQVIQMAESIYKAGVRLHRLTENYLTSSQLQVVAFSPDTIERLRGHVVHSPTVIVEDCANAQTLTYKRQEDLNLNLRNAPVKITDDHLKKVALELVDNACKFSDPGSPITVAFVTDEKVATLAVTNRGKGMTQKNISEIGLGVQFGRDLDEQQGNGLGLFICQQIAKIYDGKLEIESIPDEITTVKLVMPLAV
ncbi:MAG: response regulator [Anaerolineaceae bacterium]|nr:response regulator [Anaerolineaceae bacterium]